MWQIKDDVWQCRCNLTGEERAPGALMKGAGGGWCLLKGPSGPGLPSCPSWNTLSRGRSRFVMMRLASYAFTFTCFFCFFSSLFSKCDQKSSSLCGKRTTSNKEQWWQTWPVNDDAHEACDWNGQLSFPSAENIRNSDRLKHQISVEWLGDGNHPRINPLNKQRWHFHHVFNTFPSVCLLVLGSYLEMKFKSVLNMTANAPSGWKATH